MWSVYIQISFTVSKLPGNDFNSQINKRQIQPIQLNQHTEKNAASVAYKEKEKGREVATAQKVAGNVFSIDVFPLPHGVQRYASQKSN